MARAIVTVFALAACAAAPALAQDPAPAGPERADASRRAPVAEVGKAAPDFTLKTWDGAKTVKLSDFRAVAGDETKPGKVVVVDFYCCACPGSKRYDGYRIELAKRYAEKGVAYVVIDPNHREPVESLKASIAQNAFPFPVLLDPGQAVTDAWKPTVTPTLYVVDRQGVVRYIGAFDNRKKAGSPEQVKHLEVALDAVLAGQPVAEPTTKAFG